MANYVKATNFYAKDALLTGDPAKIIKGSEIDAEYNAIATAVGTKADLNSPTFTGVPIAPTAAFGTNTTQLATTKFVQDATGTIALQDADSVVITGGSITGITDLAVEDGGTGQSTLAANAVLIGNGTSGITSVAPSTSGNVLTSNGTAWTSTALPDLGIGVGQTWQNVAASRAINSTYTNNTGKPIQVAVIVSANPNQTNATLVVNGLNVARIQNQFGDRALVGSLSAIVPDGVSYSVSASSSSIVSWSELR
jgi:hypothetical protein